MERVFTRNQKSLTCWRFFDGTRKDIKLCGEAHVYRKSLGSVNL